MAIMVATEVKLYQEKDKEPLSKLLDDYQKELVAMDPDGRLRWTPGFGEDNLKLHRERTQKYNGQFFLAVEEEKIVGFSICEFDPETTVSGKITELYVAPAFRSKGVGSMLIDKAEEYLKTKGCKNIWISVLFFNPTALELYKRLNYKPRDISLLKTFE